MLFVALQISRGTVYKAKAQMQNGNEIIEGPTA